MRSVPKRKCRTIAWTPPRADSSASPPRCAQCHDHKFDPIPTNDYYALLGVFTSTEDAEFQLAPEPAVKEYKEQEKKVQDQEARIRDFLYTQATQLAGILADRVAALFARRAQGARPAQAGHRRRPPQPIISIARPSSAGFATCKSRPTDNRYLHGWQDEKFDLETVPAAGSGRSRRAEEGRREERHHQSGGQRSGAKDEGQRGLAEDGIILSLARPVLQRFLRKSVQTGRRRHSLLRPEPRLSDVRRHGRAVPDGAVERTSRFDARRTERAEAGSSAALSVRPRDQGCGQTEDRARANRRQPGRIWARQFRIISFRSCATASRSPFEKGSGRLELAEAIADAARIR